MLITVNFGDVNTAAAVYYTIFNASKTVYQARTNVGVTELVAGSGLYGVQVADGDVADRVVVWDIDGTTMVAIEDFAIAAVNVAAWKGATAPAMTGDAFARLGAPAGASVSADIAAIAAASALGSGAIVFVYTLTNSSGGAPIADVDVWVTTDEAGTNVLASGRTDQNGVVTFYLDAGTVYVWRQKSGWDFVNPDAEVVS